MNEVGPPPKGVDRKDLPTGAVYLKMHHYADPAKDEVWLREVEKTMRDTPTQFRREILMDDYFYSGDPVIETWPTNPKMEPVWPERAGKMPLVDQSLYYGGWDCGTSSVYLAFVLFQVTPAPHQVHALLEVLGDGTSMENFAPRVDLAIRRRLPGAWSQVMHYGDETGRNRQGATGLSSFDVAAKHGFRIRPSSNKWPGRHAAMEWLCSRDLDGGSPGFIVDEGGCTRLLGGFRGGYCWRVIEAEDGTSIKRQPEKNDFSHVHDAAQYGAQEIRKYIETGRLPGMPGHRAEPGRRRGFSNLRK